MVPTVVIDESRRRHSLAVVALIAHDAKKSDLLRLVAGNLRLFDGFRLLATRTTGQLIRSELELPVELMASGPMGGDLQLGARIVEENVDALIFLRDPLTAHPHEPDVQFLLRVCDVHQVPVATNLALAEILLQFLARRGERVLGIPNAAVQDMDTGGGGKW
jgi:methylglyoxal synthase